MPGLQMCLTAGRSGQTRCALQRRSPAFGTVKTMLLLAMLVAPSRPLKQLMLQSWRSLLAPSHVHRHLLRQSRSLLRHRQIRHHRRCRLIASESLESSPTGPMTIQPVADCMEAKVDAELLFEAAVSTYEQAVEHGVSDAAVLKGMRLLEATFHADFEATKASHYAQAAPEVSDFLHGTMHAGDESLVGRTVMNVTCMRPKEHENCFSCRQIEVHRTENTLGGRSMMRKQLLNDDLLSLSLEPGRICECGSCSQVCSRVLLQGLVSDADCGQLQNAASSHLAKLQTLEHDDSCHKSRLNLPLHVSAASGDVRMHLHYLRVVERLRRCMAWEYGLNLSSLVPAASFVNCIFPTHSVSRYGRLHVDEAATSRYHYSAILYLSDEANMTGGDLVFVDPPLEPGEQMRETRIRPRRGSAVFLSSGWENLHRVDELEHGTRLAVPVFFSTDPVGHRCQEVDGTKAGGVKLGRDGVLWEPGDEIGRARCLFQNGILPMTPQMFAELLPSWSRMFDP